MRQKADETNQCLETAARFHAVMWYNRAHPEALGKEAVEFARANWPGFLDRATVELGRILNDRDRDESDMWHVLEVMGEYAVEESHA